MTVFTFITIFAVTLLYEVGVILYNRGIIADKIVDVMILSALLALSGFFSVLVIVDETLNVIPATLGHVLGVPIGMKLRIAALVPSRKADPKKTIGFRNSAPF